MRIVALILSFFIYVNVNAATYTTVASGDWDDPDTWGGSVPNLKNNDIVVISSGNNIVRNTTLTINNQITFNIYGSLSINGTLDVRNQLEMNIFPGGSFAATDLTADNSASIDISGGGSATITNDFTGGNNTNVNVDGSLDVGGSIDVGNGSNLTGSGEITLGGSCTDGGSGFCSSGPLPVELLSFSATPNEDGMILQWSTASELNNDFFTLERSRNGKDFEVITKVEGNGTSHIQIDYNYSDDSPYLGLSYYRLSQTDYDGTTEIFPAISVLFDGNSRLNIFPNPVNSTSLKIQSSGYQSNELLRVSIFSLQGIKMANYQLQADMFGNLDTHLNMNHHWEKGTYVLELLSNNSREIIKINKE